MTCPASVTLAKGRVRPSSKYAKEGTAAHSIAEMILGGELFPPDRITVEGDEFIVGRDMLQHLNPYIDDIQGLEIMGYRIWTEQKVHLTATGGLVWGTADCIAYRYGELAILDLKYGKGVQVAPDSAQLKIYALAAAETFNAWADTFTLTVHQPRLDPKPKTFMMTKSEMLDWEQQHLTPAIEALVRGDITEHAGPHCRWCVRRDECHAYANQRSHMAADVFDAVTP